MWHRICLESRENMLLENPKWKPEFRNWFFFWSLNTHTHTSQKYHASDWHACWHSIYIVGLRSIQNCGNTVRIRRIISELYISSILLENDVYFENCYNRLKYENCVIWKCIGNVYVSFILIWRLVEMVYLVGWGCNIIMLLLFIFILGEFVFVFHMDQEAESTSNIFQIDTKHSYNRIIWELISIRYCNAILK